MKKTNNKTNLHPYYYEFDDITKECLTECNVRKDGVKIGSISCQLCGFNKTGNIEKEYVVCDKLDEAIKNYD